MQQLPSTLLKFSFHFFKKQPLAFMVFFFAPLTITLETNVIPYCFKLIIDAATENNLNRENIYSLIKMPLLVGANCWFFLLFFLRAQHWWQAYVIPKFQADIRLSVLDYISKHSYQYFANQLSGNLSNKINDLANSIETIRMIVTWNIMTTIAVTTVAVILLATINTKFALLVLAWVLVTVAVAITKAKFVNNMAKENAEDKSQLTGVIVDIISNILSVKLFARQRYEQNYAKQKQDKEQKSNKNLIIHTNLYWLRLDLVMTVVIVMMVYMLVESWRLNQISTGDFVFIFNTTFAIIYSLWHLGFSLIELLKNIGTAKQALVLISAEQEVTDKPQAKNIIVNKGKIEFKDVTFHYKQGTKIFNNKSIVINPGEKVGLVGFSGSGKSSFVNLILRFYDVESGSISIDNQNIADVTQASLRGSISMIPQDTSLFHRTLMQNIKYGNPDASDEEVIAASKKAHCHEFISKLNDGYNTMVGERGIKLSGGQRQRVAIARAMLENAPILILDEATSALDSVTETLIQESLSLLMQNRTTVVVAHRLSTLLNMDRILVFDNGKIIEDGSHEELLNKNGHYAKLWQMQVGGFLPEEGA